MSTVSGIGIERGFGIGRHRGGRPPPLLHASVWRAVECVLASLVQPSGSQDTRDALALSFSRWRT